MLEPESGYLYIVSTNYMKLDSLDELYGETTANSVWDKLLSNSLVFDQHMDNFRASEDDDRFLQAWRKQNATFVEHLNSIHPVQSSDSVYYYKPSDDYFQTNNPSYRA